MLKTNHCYYYYHFIILSLFLEIEIRLFTGNFMYYKMKMPFLISIVKI